MPDSGHLIHMPTHIDVLCGNYRDVVVYNQKAVAVDRKFLAREGAPERLRALSHARPSLRDLRRDVPRPVHAGDQAAQELIDTTPEELLRIPSPPMADFIEGYLSMKQHVLVRFGKWREIIAQELPKDPALYCTTTAMMLYAKGVAHSVLGDIAEAEKTRAAFRAAQRACPRRGGCTTTPSSTCWRSPRRC